MTQFKKNYVINRDGNKEEVAFDKITRRIEKICSDYSMNNINSIVLAQKVIQNLVNGINVSEIDDITAMKASSMSLSEPEYNTFAGRIIASNIQRTTPNTFYDAMKILNDNDILNKDTWAFIEKNKDVLNSSIVNSRDMNYDYFGIQTLKKSYLTRVNDKVMETPQYMFMRVACGVNYKHSIKEAIDMYNLLSNGIYMHSSPTLYNSGTKRPQLASCFLIDMKDDSIEGIFDTLKVAAKISKYAGGVGFNSHKIRSYGSKIKGTNGKSKGIVPWLKLFNDTALGVDQAGRRKGSFAAYLEPHHADFMSFMEIRMPTKNERAKAEDLFTAVWLSELFMTRVLNDENWTFFDPNTNEETRKLEDYYDDFNEKNYTNLYEKLEREGYGVSTKPAREVWFAIQTSQLRTGNPYLLNKDVINRTSNQKNLGTIKSSNLCR